MSRRSPFRDPATLLDHSLDSAPQQAGYTIEKRERSRHWMVIDPQGELVCLTVYTRGAGEVVRRLAG